MAVLARDVIHEEPRLSDRPLSELRLVDMPYPSAERAWPAWIVGSTIIGTLLGLLYVATTLG
jgi:hypothetical protein